MRYLLLISCSQRKHENPESWTAIDVYDGPLYRMLRKLRREGNFPESVDVGIISAKYGLIPCQHGIVDYDQRMTLERAVELAPEVQENLHRQMLAYAGITGELISAYDQVFINLGKVYMRTLEGFHWGLVSTLEASGGIGQRVSQTKTWLDLIHDYNPTRPQEFTNSGIHILELTEG